jgi:hypothetical protein
MDAAIILYEQCVGDPLATVVKVETKPTTKWCVPRFTQGRVWRITDGHVGNHCPSQQSSCSNPARDSSI